MENSNFETMKERLINQLVEVENPSERRDPFDSIMQMISEGLDEQNENQEDESNERV